ncbi:MAG: helix-turn-helix transcriptional regulator [Spirochaetota bacterium]
MRYVMFPDLSELRAENCGTAILNPGWTHPARRLDTSVIILGKKSTVEIDEDSFTLRVGPGKLCVLAAGRHHCGRRPIDAPASYYWMHFSTSRPPSILDESDALAILNNEAVAKARLANALLLPSEIQLNQLNVLSEMFHDLLSEQESPSFTPQKFQTLFRLLMIKANEYVLSEHAASGRIPINHSLVYATIETIFENLCDPNFSVKSLASEMQHNPDYLGRLFKSVMSKPIGVYINDQRIHYSVTRLVSTSDTIEKIARDCGFASRRNFIRQFKARMDATPSEIRLRYSMMHITNV